MPHPANFDNIAGKRYGRLVALSYHAPKWLFACDCGEQKRIYATNVKRGLTMSCGCLNRKLCSERKDNITHGKSLTPEYKVWQGMHQRCGNPNDKSYSDYGGRGIIVCERWHAFENFLEDMGVRPFKGASLDRKEVNGNYEPDNCRWATYVQQARNRRDNLRIEAFGKSGCLADFFDNSHSKEYQRARELIRKGVAPEAAIGQCR